mmetsp:Transcript_56523/g.177525  ORF Transcript_56523/g.177525 Transcript_56523/m.177525 type:complete len:341 (-) Transcript_56523:7-1029(-)
MCGCLPLPRRCDGGVRALAGRDEGGTSIGRPSEGVPVADLFCVLHLCRGCRRPPWKEDRLWLSCAWAGIWRKVPGRRRRGHLQRGGRAGHDDVLPSGGGSAPRAFGRPGRPPCGACHPSPPRLCPDCVRTAGWHWASHDCRCCNPHRLHVRGCACSREAPRRRRRWARGLRAGPEGPGRRRRSFRAAGRAAAGAPGGLLGDDVCSLPHGAAVPGGRGFPRSPRPPGRSGGPGLPCGRLLREAGVRRRHPGAGHEHRWRVHCFLRLRGHVAQDQALELDRNSRLRVDAAVPHRRDLDGTRAVAVAQRARREDGALGRHDSERGGHRQPDQPDGHRRVVPLI